MDSQSSSKAIQVQNLASMLLFSLVLAPSAHAGEENTFGIFQVNASLSTGAADGFRQLFVDPDELSTLLSPAAARTGEPNGQLVIENLATSWTRVHVGETLVGVIGPLTTGHLRNVTAGTYKVSMELPNGYTRNVQIGTVASDGSVVMPKAGPTPVPDSPEEEPEAADPPDAKPEAE